MIRKVKKAFFLTFFVFSSFLSAEGKLQSAIEKQVETFAEDHSIVSIAAVVIGREDHQKFEKIITRGNLSLKSPIPVNAFSEFRIGSLSQLFTAAALAYFVEEGQVSLNDPISKFLPKSTKLPSYEGKEITLGELATHTSGLPDMPYSLTSRSSYSVSQMYRFLSKYELKHPPGTRYEYSNFGYALLTNLLSRLSKKTFSDLLEQIIIKPLHLSETTFTLNSDQKMRLVTGYELGKGVSPLLNEKIYSVFIGSGGLYSTPKDMLTFLSFNLRKERTSLNAILPIMQKSYHTFKNFQVGLGWKITPLSESKDFLYFLDGNLFGFGMYMGIIPERNLGVVILFNQGEFNPTPLAQDIFKILGSS